MNIKYNAAAEVARIQFHDYITKTDLVELEDVRDYVEMHCMENAADADDILEGAINTLKYYIDCKDDAEEVFNAYRK